MNSESVEDYLKTIYLIQDEQNDLPVSTSSLASRLGVTNASVTGMLKHLSSTEPKLVNYERYYGVTLSPSGYKSALEIVRHHRLIESFLFHKLGYSWDEVHSEAERLEHVISDEMEDHLVIALGNPISDPHGDPIPDIDGKINKPDLQSLAIMSLGQLVVIRRILGQEPELLRYLSELGLVISAHVQIESNAPFNGPICIRLVGSSETILALSREIAEKILVLPLNDSLGKTL